MKSKNSQDSGSDTIKFYSSSSDGQGEAKVKNDEEKSATDSPNWRVETDPNELVQPSDLLSSNLLEQDSCEVHQKNDEIMVPSENSHI